MNKDHQRTGIFRHIFGGFIAGFAATLIFHQAALWVLWRAGLAPFAPYATAPVPPFGIPAVISLALWGGVWGIVLSVLQDHFSRRGYWAETFGFGAVFPTLVALLIVLPLKGKPMGGGWHWQLLVTAFLINGVWGLGTNAILKLFLPKNRRTEIDTPECLPGAVCH